MAVDPVGLDFTIDSKVVDKPNRKATITGSVYWNGVKRAVFTLAIDASDTSKSVADFGYSFQMSSAA